MEDTEFVLNKIRKIFIDNHVSFVFEDVCMEKVWEVNKKEKSGFTDVLIELAKNRNDLVLYSWN